MTINLPNIGTESEKGVVSALDDLFGPSFRTVGEYLADKVRYHRLRSLQKILIKARDLGPAGAEFIAPPPMKFLLPFIESASLEEEDDEVMSELWAKLLADASTEFDSKQLHFIRVLKEITGREARLLHAIASESRGDARITMSFPGDIEIAHLDLTQNAARHFLQTHVGKIPTAELAAEFIRTHENPGAHIAYIQVGEREEGQIGWNTAEDGLSGLVTDLEKEHGGLTFELLRSVSLIEEIRCENVELDGVGLEFHAWTITGLGGEFYRDCASAAFVSEANGDA